ncbi:SM-20-related protein [Methylobacillus rhizosphaerae]|uniref:SM-20-related protein n=1 Tax=Methylobacillus rhizosphaerae TaxID=551994 RepID=A0A239ALN8_9PROT|nr:2OG-Fe(II) oxygenase [Methylobacillus rhizosphaerae]SNR96577.1 SM-20-related protein [Methylobacillus rhizosphaerae]
MLSPIELNRHIDGIIEAIASQGYAVIPEFFPAEFIAALQQEALSLQEAGKLQRASIGKAEQNQLNTRIRGDLIHWLDHTHPSAIQQEFAISMETLRESLNQHFYLGLFELENHFAIYPPGAVYHKHLDQFRGNEERQISCILYLNDQWQEEDGGQLRLYLDGTEAHPYIDVLPQGGTLVVFLSGKFWHEVLPATRPRTSLTGWFRKRSSELR